MPIRRALKIRKEKGSRRRYNEREQANEVLQDIDDRAYNAAHDTVLLEFGGVEPVDRKRKDKFTNHVCDLHQKNKLDFLQKYIVDHQPQHQVAQHHRSSLSTAAAVSSPQHHPPQQQPPQQPLQLAPDHHHHQLLQLQRQPQPQPPANDVLAHASELSFKNVKLQIEKIKLARQLKYYRDLNRQNTHYLPYLLSSRTRTPPLVPASSAFSAPAQHASSASQAASSHLVASVAVPPLVTAQPATFAVLPHTHQPLAAPAQSAAARVASACAPLLAHAHHVALSAPTVPSATNPSPPPLHPPLPLHQATTSAASTPAPSSSPPATPAPAPSSPRAFIPVAPDSTHEQSHTALPAGAHVAVSCDALAPDPIPGCTNPDLDVGADGGPMRSDVYLRFADDDNPFDWEFSVDPCASDSATAPQAPTFDVSNAADCTSVAQAPSSLPSATDSPACASLFDEATAFNTPTRHTPDNRVAVAAFGELQPMPVRAALPPSPSFGLCEDVGFQLDQARYRADGEE